MNFCGIDPGANGGIALLDESGRCLRVVKMPSEESIPSAIEQIVAGECKIAVERVGGYIGHGPFCPTCRQPRNRSPGSSMFNFGRGVGVIIGCLLTLDKEVTEVEPQVWQSAIVQRRRGWSQDSSDWKRELKKHAASLYPDINVTLWSADALLIARYAMLQYVGAAEGIPLE